MSLTVDNCKIAYLGTVSVRFIRGQIVILKLAAKLDDELFSVWIKPPKSSEVKWEFKANKLKWQFDKLSHYGKRVPCVSLKTALLMFYTFLKISPVPVLLVGYSTKPIGTLLLTAIQKVEMVDLFHGVIAGFANSLPIWRDNFPSRTRKEQFRLSSLSKDFLGITHSAPSYNLTYCLLTVAELATKISTKSQFIENSESYVEAFGWAMNTSENYKIYRGLEPLLAAVPEVVLRKMVRAGLSFPLLDIVFQQNSSVGLRELLAEKLNSNDPLVATDDETQVDIVNFFEKEYIHCDPNDPFTKEQDAIMDELGSSLKKPNPTWNEPSSSKRSGNLRRIGRFLKRMARAGLSFFTSNKNFQPRASRRQKWRNHVKLLVANDKTGIDNIRPFFEKYNRLCDCA